MIQREWRFAVMILFFACCSCASQAGRKGFENSNFLEYEILGDMDSVVATGTIVDRLEREGKGVEVVLMPTIDVSTGKNVVPMNVREAVGELKAMLPSWYLNEMQWTPVLIGEKIIQVCSNPVRGVHGYVELAIRNIWGMTGKARSTKQVTMFRTALDSICAETIRD